MTFSASFNPSGGAAIVGLGMTEMTREYTYSASGLAAIAIRNAIADAGLTKDDVDGLLVNPGVMGNLRPDLQKAVGIENLRLQTLMNGQGSTAGQMVQYASLAVQAGLANVVVCVFADDPLRGGSAGAAYGGSGRVAGGIASLNNYYGAFGANTAYALAARRHMALYGTTQDQLGAVAVSTRKWAQLNPIAMQRGEMTLDDYHGSRWIVEPFHLLDCTLVTNGAVAVVVTSRERAKELKQPPVYVTGMGQGHPGNPRHAGAEYEVNTGAVQAGETAYAMAGVGPKDIGVRELYDCYTYTTIVTLEDYGFAPKGEGGSFVEDGKLGPGGSHPTNTGGGELSGYYMWGMTPLSEAVIQARGQGGERQVADNTNVLVSTQGGILDMHATLILSGDPTAGTGGHA
ncbi:MAG: thiolase family protein [Chloroflexi bacterium]|nr:thiolase family protein [Chloroflexota bacterium]MDA1146002.1 thiolase family protein [Chloroflexota bacterium]